MTDDARSTQSSWWLEPGAESCPFCEVRFHVEAASYCIECDRPICPLCVTEIMLTRTVTCPECRRGGNA